MMIIIVTIVFILTSNWSFACEKTIAGMPLSGDQRELFSELSCELKKKVLNTASKKPLESIDELLTDTMLENQLVIIGESHHFSSTIHYSDIIKNMKKTVSEFNCLFVEFPSMSAIQRNMNSGRVYPSITEANIQNINIVPVDTKNGSSLIERNKEMSENIKDAFKNGDCKKGLFITGNNHIKNLPHGNGHQISIQKELGKNSIKFTTFSFLGKKNYDYFYPLGIYHPPQIRYDHHFTRRSFLDNFCSTPPEVEGFVHIDLTNLESDFDGYIIFPN